MRREHLLRAAIEIETSLRALGGVGASFEQVINSTSKVLEDDIIDTMHFIRNLRNIAAHETDESFRQKVGPADYAEFLRSYRKIDLFLRSERVRTHPTRSRHPKGWSPKKFGGV